jgi:hypothetical protein
MCVGVNRTIPRTINMWKSNKDREGKKEQKGKKQNNHGKSNNEQWVSKTTVKV